MLHILLSITSFLSLFAKNAACFWKDVLMIPDMESQGGGGGGGGSACQSWHITNGL